MLELDEAVVGGLGRVRGAGGPGVDHASAIQKFKLATLAILAMFAIRTWSWSRKLDREARNRQDDE